MESDQAHAQQSRPVHAHLARAPAVQILEREGVALVFGLEWFPLLGADLERQALVAARRRKAIYRVVAAGEASSVGLLYEAIPLSRGTRLSSAAAVFASTHQEGTFAAIIPLPNGRRWMVAVHESAVMSRGDMCFDSEDALRHALQQLREAHPQLSVVTMDSHDPLGSIFRLGSHAGALVRESRLKRRLRPAVAMTTLLVAAWAGVGRSMFPVADTSLNQEVDPATAWRDATARVAAHHRVQGVTGFLAVYEALLDVPVLVAGWALRAVECVPTTAHWQCSARFHRGSTALNEGLLAARPMQWRLGFDPLDGAEAVWAVPMPTLRLSSQDLKTESENDTRLLSILQSVASAFSELRVEGPKPIALRPPLDARQRPLPRPAGLPVFQTRSLRLQSPMRSVSVLVPEMAHMSWDRVSLTVTETDRPSLRNSGLRLSLWGTLYEIKGDDNELDGAGDPGSGIVSSPRGRRSDGYGGGRPPTRPGDARS